MPQISLTKSYADGQSLFESDLDNIKDGIETFLNVTKIDSENIQDGGITTAKLATGAVTAAKIASGAVTTAKIATGAVTTAKIASSAVTADKIASSAVTTDKLASSAVTTAKIASEAVTIAKRAARDSSSSTATVGNIAVSSSSGSYSKNFGTSYEDVTNLSVTITTNGNPVILELIAGSTSAAYVGVTDAGSPFGTGTVKFVRDGSTDLAILPLNNGNGTQTQSPGSIRFVDDVAAGTYTYKLQATRTTDLTSTDVVNCKLVAREIL